MSELSSHGQYYRPGYGLERNVTLAEHERMLRIAESAGWTVARIRDKEEHETREEYETYRADINSMIATDALRSSAETED